MQLKQQASRKVRQERKGIGNPCFKKPFTKE
jgi:hypothetical protein